MNAFETAGWQWIDASLAFEDAVFRSSRRTLPCRRKFGLGACQGDKAF